MIDVEIITDKKINYSEFSPDEGILPARLLFVDGPLLEFMEYLHKEQRLKHRFHLIDYIESRGRTPLSSHPKGCGLLASSFPILPVKSWEERLPILRQQL